jgi:muramoyltetrapeptide carboxypeptidase
MLRPGARIAIVAPSGIFDPARVQRGMQLLEDWGFRPEPMPGLHARDRYLNGDDATRRGDLVHALCGDYDAVWMARGGYGLARLLPALPFGAMRRIPFFGFSDGTALLNPLHDRGLVAVHAPVLNALCDLNDDMTRDHLHALLTGPQAPAVPCTVAIPGPVDAPVVGGNLCVIASLCGTPYQLVGRGRLVLLEDVGEVAYKLDRLLTQVIQAGCLDGCAGVALGTFVGADPPAGADWTAEEVLLDLLRPLGVPVLTGLPIGHGPRNLALPFGRVRLEHGFLRVG